MSTNSSNASRGVTAPQPAAPTDPLVFKEPVQAHFDGSHSTGKNRCAVGFVLTDATGKTLVRNHFEIDYTTSVQTEATALIHALNTAQDLGVRHLNIFGDCSSVIEIVRGDASTSKEDLRTLTDTAQSLLNNFEKTTLEHIKRSQNTTADSLAHTPLDTPLQS